MKKRFCALLMVAAMLASMASLNTINAAGVGKITGQAEYTDIAAHINNFPIKSYNVLGNTYIIAEQLALYGFDVVWNAHQRTLCINENFEAFDHDDYLAMLSVAAEVRIDPIAKWWTKAFPVYSTDIKTYLDGKLIESKNIGGQTVIPFDVLAKYGSCIFNGGSGGRSIRVYFEKAPASFPAAEYSPVSILTEEGNIDFTGVWTNDDGNYSIIVYNQRGSTVDLKIEALKFTSNGLDIRHMASAMVKNVEINGREGEYVFEDSFYGRGRSKISFYECLYVNTEPLNEAMFSIAHFKNTMLYRTKFLHEVENLELVLGDF